MNPLRYVGGEWTATMVAVFLVALAVLGIVGWMRAREKRGDWGPGLAGIPEVEGYLPADLRQVPSGAVPAGRERWLLGLAAPFVEQAGLLHERWSLVPAFCDVAWRRRLAAVASGRRVARSRDWKAEVARIEDGLAAAAPVDGGVDPRPLLVADLAFVLRLGVAARHTSAPRARKVLERHAAPLQAAYSDWFGFGDAFIRAAEAFRPGRNADLRADLRTLYGAGGPWADPAWPAR